MSWKGKNMNKRWMIALLVGAVLMLGAQQAPRSVPSPTQSPVPPAGARRAAEPSAPVTATLPETVKAYIAGVVQQTRERIKALRSQIPQWRDDIKLAHAGQIVQSRGLPPVRKVRDPRDRKSRYEFDSAGAKQGHIQKLQKNLDDAEAELRPYEVATDYYDSISVRKIKTGVAGQLMLKERIGEFWVRHTAKVRQVIDDENMLIDINVVDGVRGEWHVTEYIWVRGVPTSSYVDNETLSPAVFGSVSFVGVAPVSYESMGGSRRVACIEAIEMGVYEAQIDAEICRQLKGGR